MMPGTTKRKNRKPRSKRKPRGFFQVEGVTELVIPLKLQDRLALRYLMTRMAQPTPQKTVIHLIKSMIMALNLEDELKDKAANDADDSESPQYTNTAGEAVDPAEFAAGSDPVPIANDAVIVGDPSDLATAGVPVGPAVHTGADPQV